VAVVLLGRLSAGLPAMLDKSNMKAVDHLCGRLNFNVRYAAHTSCYREIDRQTASLTFLPQPVSMLDESRTMMSHKCWLTRRPIITPEQPQSSIPGQQQGFGMAD
jgi:hypothetical protein